MANDTFMKRQKEAARRKKQFRKGFRRMEKRNETASGENRVEGVTPKIAPLVIRRGPTIL